LATCPLEFNFLGHGRDRVADLADNRLQYIGRDTEPPGPGTDLGWLGRVDLISKRRTFDAMHGWRSSLRGQRELTTFVPLLET
jgi:hypothetical protein